VQRLAERDSQAEDNGEQQDGERPPHGRPAATWATPRLPFDRRGHGT
jgi:hypothetical protein